MRFEPTGKWVLGKAMVPKPTSIILIPNAAAAKGRTRCYLIEEVSEAAASAGYKVGDIVCAIKVYDINTFDGRKLVAFRFDTPDEEAIFWVRDVPLSEFVDLDGNPIEAPRAEVDVDQTRAAGALS